MRYIFLVFGLIVLTVMAVLGKRGDLSRKPPLFIFPDMDWQPKQRPQTASDFFQDGLGSRLPVDGTVARGTAFTNGTEVVWPYLDHPVNTGRLPSLTNFIENIPVPVTEQLLARGRERFNINCAPCHGATGAGNGITTKLGMTTIRDLHLPQVVKLPDGDLFSVITGGRGLMQGYAANLDVHDRWAIVAYVRALQRSRLATLEDVPAEDLAKFKK
jgi:mono/diheme cytochrome c family protein